jgi:hypothetical protein
VIALSRFLWLEQWRGRQRFRPTCPRLKPCPDTLTEVKCALIYVAMFSTEPTCGPSVF